MEAMSIRCHITWGNGEGKMRCLLLLHEVLTETCYGAAVSVVILSTLLLIAFMNQTKTSNSLTTCVATVFLFGSIITWLWQSMAMKNNLCGGPPWYILIRYPFHVILVSCQLSTNAIVISFQNSGSCSPCDLRDW